MCRFAYYQGRPVRLSHLITEPSNSLIRQSVHAKEREEPLNGDGFGVAWYPSGLDEPARFRSVTPAWNNENLREIARVVTSRCVMAHVRSATQDIEVSEANCHPFKRGPFSFMHNGDIAGFAGFRRELLAGLSDAAFASIRGTTDSEHLFALFLDEIAGMVDQRSTSSIAAALERAVSRAVALAARTAPAEHCYVNLVVSSGESAVACRYTTDAPDGADSLYLNQGRRYVCEDGLCRMLPAKKSEHAVLVSSEPLSDDGGWEKVPVNHLVLIEPSLSVSLRPLTLQQPSGRRARRPAFERVSKGRQAPVM
jgi:predicted glutamine amidotransferase